jgi:hypothetical protein
MFSFCTRRGLRPRLVQKKDFWGGEVSPNPSLRKVSQKILLEGRWPCKPRKFELKSLLLHIQFWRLETANDFVLLDTNANLGIMQAQLLFHIGSVTRPAHDRTPVQNRRSLPAVVKHPVS